MKKRTAVFFSAVGAVCLTGALAWGQTTVKRLTEDILKRMIPVMKAEAAQTQAALNRMGLQLEHVEKMAEETEQRIKDLEAGKIDPLAYLKKKSKYLTVPPSVSYKQKLSRIASLRAYGDPIAVFSYGIDSTTARNLAGGGEAAALQYANFGDIYKGPAGQKIKAAEEEFKSFYGTKGFTDFECTNIPGWSCVSPDGRAAAWFVFVNLYAGTKDVETIPDGPILMLGLTGRWSPGEKPQPMEKPENASPVGKEQALRLAKISEEEYGEYLGTLVMARNDAADPANIGLDYEGPMDPEMKKTLEEMKIFYEIRRQNSLVYKRHAAVVDPLLSAMGL